MIEAMKLAYADRAQHLGDPDTVKVPIAGLSSKSYAKVLRESIDPDKAKPARDIRPGNPVSFDGDNTTHYSVVDRFGNAVSNTYTLNLSYGNGLVAAGTGVLLNNELDDFAAKPDAPNAFGLIGLNAANAPGPNKRPLSSMTPTIVLKDGKPVLITGSPGGSRIITTVLQVILNVLDYRMPVADRRGGAAPASSMAAGRSLGRTRRAACGAEESGGARPQDRAAHLGHVGEFDPGDAQGADRRRRHAHTRRAGGGILTLNFRTASADERAGDTAPPRLGLAHVQAKILTMTASLIGRLGSSAFRLSTTAVSMSLTGSRFSSESAPRPFQHGIRGRGGTI